jgi:uncharacterized phage protein (TIGR01671 family)
MREIKFRAWDTLNKRFVSDKMFNWGLLVGEEDNRGICIPYSRVSDVCMPLMQFTGLHDKDGREIYEGDIVYLSGYGNYIAEWPFVQLFESSWEDDIGAIIGNIYENHELLKGE